MKILCIIKRAKGTHTKMPDDGTVYAFLPNENGDHVADVANPAHIARLLAIGAYIPYGDPVANGLTEVKVDDVQPTLESEEPQEAVMPPDLDGMTHEELLAEYHHRFGRAAPPLMKFGTLVKKLTEKRAAVAA